MFFRLLFGLQIIFITQLNAQISNGSYRGSYKAKSGDKLPLETGEVGRSVMAKGSCYFSIEGQKFLLAGINGIYEGIITYTDKKGKGTIQINEFMIQEFPKFNCSNTNNCTFLNGSFRYKETNSRIIITNKKGLRIRLNK